MMNRFAFLTLWTVCVCMFTHAQESTSGISVPVTISGEVRQTHESADPTSTGAGFRVVLSPSLRLGPHWFFYAALDTHSSSYLPYETGVDDNRPVDVQLTQAFVGYVRSSSRGSVLIKAGQISSAFGLFPVDYDDAKMPLINTPLAYTANLPLRADQLPCGVPDVVWQAYGDDVAYHCGGSTSERYGLTPVTLYGLPALETQVSMFRFDARLQITNSSPANPHGLFSDSQSLQWTAGAGYTAGHALHLGVSGFRGPYLNNVLTPFLAQSTTVHDFPASGIGVDANWSLAHWSAQGEWMYFQFALPGFIQSPSESAAYAEVKRILTPRVFAAARINYLDFGPIKDQSGASAEYSTAPQQLYEATIGYRLNREQLLKAGACWNHENAWSSLGSLWPQTHGYAFELQLITTLTAVSKAFR